MIAVSMWNLPQRCCACLITSKVRAFAHLLVRDKQYAFMQNFGKHPVLVDCCRAIFRSLKYDAVTGPMIKYASWTVGIADGQCPTAERESWSNAYALGRP
jgi:hypothetical protein